MPGAAAEPDPWITASAAARLLGCHRHAVRRLAEAGELTVRRLGNVRARYLRADVAKVALMSVTVPGVETEHAS